MYVSKADILPMLNLIKAAFGLLSWKDVERFNTEWNERIELMARYIPAECRSILDLGCGEMTLKNYIPETCKYLPVDYTDRGLGTIVCDFNKREYPSQPRDLTFMSGIIEYVRDYDWFIQKAVFGSSTIIASYCTLDTIPSKRQRRLNAWHNHLTDKELVSSFRKYGAQHIEADEYGENTIYVFKIPDNCKS